MTDTTPRTGAPLLAAAQAQKHVTHNEALYQFDAFLCARFLDRDLSTPPPSPADGDTYLVKATGTGSWTGQSGKIAYCADGDWRFYQPFAGLVAFVSDESVLIVYDGVSWVGYASLIVLQNVPVLGINTTADSVNKLSVQANAALFTSLPTGSGGDGDMRVTLSKQAMADTASLVLQNNFSGRAEIGLAGDDNVHFKVSPDGASWTDALDIAASTGVVTLPSVDINGGTVDGASIGATTAAAGKFTTLQAIGAVLFSPSNANVVLSPSGSGSITIAPAAAGMINNCSIGSTTASTGKFTGITTPSLNSGAASPLTLGTSGGTQLTIANVASAVNNLQTAGSASGGGTAILSAIGTDANIDIVLTPKGSGGVRIPAVTNGTVATVLSSVGPTGAHTTVQEWFPIRNSNGIVRYVPGF